MPFLIITLSILIVSLFIYLKSPETLGKKGENRVKRKIGKTVENERYVINDLMLMSKRKTCQIDHIVINQRGIFVIETKNYSGQIYGLENQREWTQVLAYGKVKNKLYNPLKQNATHIYNVAKIVGNLPIRSLVVFVQNNTQHIQASNVIPLSALKRTLQSGVNVLSAQKMKTAYRALMANKAEITMREHVRNIKKQQKALAENLCPRCGEKLMERNGKYGAFVGCVNYPKCKFIKKT